MSQRIKLETLKGKIEHMIQAMDGPPDHEEIENNRLLSELENTSKSIKEELKDCKDKLIERIQRDDDQWYQSKERILLDEDIKAIFASCESQLAYLRQIFKEYQNRNKLKIPPEELRARTRNIDLLREQINLLKKEFKNQSEREQRNRRDQDTSVLYKARMRGQQKEFVELFSINQATGEQELPGSHDQGADNDIEEERDLNKEEEDILKAFKDNDAELEGIAMTIVEELKKVKMNAENIETGIDRQTDLLKSVNARAEKNLNNLQVQSSELKDAINKHKSAKQCCFDLCLLLVFLGLLCLCLKLLQGKGYL